MYISPVSSFSLSKNYFSPIEYNAKPKAFFENWLHGGTPIEPMY